MKKTILNSRLCSAAGFVRQGALFADIGTDHAYLPLFLLESGRISHAVCSDVNAGPLESARRNVEAAGYSDSIDFYLTDGAAALSDLGVTDFAICGMGGELISDIIERAPYLADPKINLILQPMTRQAHLRSYLASHGFHVSDERYTYETGKYYVCLLANYTGGVREISPSEAEIGCPDTRPEERDARVGYLYARAASLSRAVRGKGEGALAERGVLADVLAFLGGLGESPCLEKYL